MPIKKCCVGNTKFLFALTASLVCILFLTFVFQNYLPKNSEVFETLDNLNSPSNPTMGWRTYTDAQYGFSLRYPDGWEVSRVETGKPAFKKMITLARTDSNTLYNITITVESEEYSTIVEVLRRASGDNIRDFLVNGKVVAKQAVYITGAGGSDYVINTIFDWNGETIGVEASFLNPPNPDDISDYNKILATFSFLTR